MSKKKNSTANINFILILTIFFVMVAFSISNYVQFNKSENFLSLLDEKVVSIEESEIIEETQEESAEDIEEFLMDLSAFGIDAGNVGLDVLRVIFVWIPLIHAIFLLFFAGLSRMIFSPSSNSVTIYRTLMAFVYLNIIVTIIVLIVGVIIHYSAIKKIKMLGFVLQCVVILFVNFRNTYSNRIKGEF